MGWVSHGVTYAGVGLLPGAGLRQRASPQPTQVLYLMSLTYLGGCLKIRFAIAEVDRRNRDQKRFCWVVS